MHFVSLDGVDWTDRKAKAKLYVGKSIRKFMERVREGGDLKPVQKDTVPRVIGSAALVMADGNLIALPRSLANEGTPIIINNACVSWHRLAKNFIFGGARAYIGTLIPVTPIEAHGVIKRMLNKHLGCQIASNPLGCEDSLPVVRHGARSRARWSLRYRCAAALAALVD